MDREEWETGKREKREREREWEGERADGENERWREKDGRQRDLIQMTNGSEILSLLICERRKKEKDLSIALFFGSRTARLWTCVCFKDVCKCK